MKTTLLILALMGLQTHCLSQELPTQRETKEQQITDLLRAAQSDQAEIEAIVSESVNKTISGASTVSNSSQEPGAKSAELLKQTSSLLKNIENSLGEQVSGIFGADSDLDLENSQVNKSETKFRVENTYATRESGNRIESKVKIHSPNDQSPIEINILRNYVRDSESFVEGNMIQIILNTKVMVDSTTGKILSINSTVEYLAHRDNKTGDMIKIDPKNVFTKEELSDSILNSDFLMKNYDVIIERILGEKERALEPQRNPLPDLRNITKAHVGNDSVLNI